MNIGSRHLFTSRGTSNQIDLATGYGEFFNIEGSVSINESVQYITKLGDFPASSGGVITLEDNKCYILIGTIDLLGDRLVCGTNQIIYGINSEVSTLKSTGLTGDYLITSDSTINIRDITIDHTDKVFDLDGAGTEVIDWNGVNVNNSSDVGVISNYSNVIITNSAWIDSAGLMFDGTFGTIGLVNCLFTNLQDLPLFSTESTCVISRRIKCIESSFVVTGTGNAWSIDASTTVPNQGFILTSCNFSGGGSYITGLTSTDNESLWFKNLGINNSTSLASLYISASGITATTQNVWTKITVTTSLASISQKFTHSNNKLTYIGNLTQNFRVAYHISLSGSVGNNIKIGVSKNGQSPTDDTVMITTMDAAGRINNLGLTCYLQLALNDYIELWVMNTSASNNVTCDQINLCAGGEF